MALDGSDVKLVSTGKGKCTCSYFFPSGDRILYCSTHAASPECPPKPDYSKGYVWRIEPTYDIYTVRPDGTDLKPLVVSPGYDAEATISRDGKKIVFTSDRDGDLELYSMDSDGTNTKRLTFSPGYDGGAFFSPDGKSIVYRARHIEDQKELDDYQALLKQHLVRPTKLEIYVMDTDGKNQRQITSLDAGSFAPFMHPNQKKIIYASNYGDPKGREFDLFLVNLDGTGVERVTRAPEFDGFPMWTSDGKKLVFASNRNGKVHGETDLFIADWKD
jgi:Tol biopolymer transport system component